MRTRRREDSARLFYLTAPESMNPIDPVTIAIGLFLDFLLNPLNTRLGGPCLNCGKYFVKENDQHRVYCSRHCGLRHTALAVNRRRRAREHDERLQIARKSAAEWAKSRSQVHCKEWVSGHTGISKNWLTRRLKSGELSEPVR